jgi:hypothetical protein
MVKRPISPLNHDAPPAVRQKQEIADATERSLATIRSDPASTFDDQQHKDLDRQVLKALENIPKDDWFGFIAISIYCTCLFSNDTLPAITVSEACCLVMKHRELEEHVREALESKSFRKIRNMGEIYTHYPIFGNLHKSRRNLTTPARTESRCKSTWRCRNG